MNKYYHKFFTPVMIVIVMLLAMLGTLEYSFDNRVYTYLNPVVGCATAFYFIHRKKSILPIFLTFYSASLATRIFLVDESLVFSIVYCFVLFIPILIMMVLFSRFHGNFRIGDLKGNKSNKSYILNYFTNIIVTTFIGTLLMFLVYNAFIGFEFSYLKAFKEMFLGNFFGMFLFNMSIYFAVVQDFTVFFKKKQGILNALFLVVFAALCLVIFRKFVPGLDFEHFSFLFYFLYILIGLLYSYRILIMSNFIYIIIFAGYALFDLTSIDYFSVLTEVSLFLTVANLSAVSIKMMIIIYLRKSQKEVEKSNTINQLVDTTNRYIGDLEGLNSNPGDFFKHFIVDFFKIGCKIMPKYDKASCYVLENDKIKYLSTKGYDVDILNYCDFDPNTFSWNFDNPTIINGYNDVNFSARNFEYLNLYNARYGHIKQSLTFSLDYAGFKGAMSFDIFEYNDYLYDPKTIETFKTFHRLVKSYISMGSLYVESSKLKSDIILSMVKTLGFYDDYTKNHSIDVSNLSKEVCDELGLDNKLKEQAYYASIVHDIGKIGISNEILNKKSRLTNEEYALIKIHPVQGYNILSEVQNLEEIAVIVRHHHERWDGKGYPDGLVGDKIPFLAQLIGVCDSLSAMLSKRVYQDAKTVTEVIEELKAQRGKQFSPIPCDAMINILERRGLV